MIEADKEKVEVAVLPKNGGFNMYQGSTSVSKLID
jgi:hypothetical protein